MSDPSAAKDHLSASLRCYAKQLPTVLSVPNMAATLRAAADEIDRLGGQRDNLTARLLADPDRAAVATLDSMPDKDGCW